MKGVVQFPAGALVLPAGAFIDGTQHVPASREQGAVKLATQDRIDIERVNDHRERYVRFSASPYRSTGTHLQGDKEEESLVGSFHISPLGTSISDRTLRAPLYPRLLIWSVAS